MKKYKLLSWVLSLVMALTVFSVPTGAFAADEPGNDEPEYCLAYYGEEGTVYLEDTIDFSQIGRDCCIFVCKPNEEPDGACRASKLIWHNPYSDSAVVTIGYTDWYEEGGEQYSEDVESEDQEVEITNSTDQSIKIIPQSPGTARLSVDVYDTDDENVKVATIPLTVKVTQEDVDAYENPEPEYTGSIALGGTYTWSISDDEDDYYIHIPVNTLESDTAVQLSVETDNYGRASLFEVGNTEDAIAYTWRDVGEEPDSAAAVLRKDKKYFIELSRDESTKEIKVSLTLNPIQEIRYHSDKVLYENTNGTWTPEYIYDDDDNRISTGKRYYEYEYGWNKGDTLTLVDKDGNTDVYTCEENDQDDYDYYRIFVNENGTVITEDDLDIDVNDPQEKTHWTVGSDNVFYIEYQGLRVECKATVEESPVDSVTVTPARQYTVAEDEYYRTEGLDGKDYYCFYIPGWNKGDKITIKYKTGETKTYVLSFDERGDDVWTLVGGTEKLDTDELYQESDQDAKHWTRTVGATNTFYAVFMGVRSNDLKAKMIRTLAKAKLTLSATQLVYTGKARRPSVKTMKYGSTSLKKGTHYDLDYCDKAIGVGNYEIGFIGIGNYGGYKEAKFKVIPKGATILKPKAAKKAITVKWKKLGTKLKYQNANYDTKSAYITGYQVQYGLKSSFKGAKTKTVKGYKKTSLKIKKLKGKKKYYVRVRTYMKIKGVGTFYSKWSAKKAVTTKK